MPEKASCRANPPIDQLQRFRFIQTKSGKAPGRDLFLNSVPDNLDRRLKDVKLARFMQAIVHELSEFRTCQPFRLLYKITRLPPFAFRPILSLTDSADGSRKKNLGWGSCSVWVKDVVLSQADPVLLHLVWFLWLF